MPRLVVQELPEKVSEVRDFARRPRCEEMNRNFEEMH